MNLLERYIARHVLLSSSLAFLVLVALISFFWFIDELGNVGKGRYDLAAAAQYVLLITPRLAYQLLPMAVLIGTTIGLGMLSSSSELIAIRSAGVSVRQLAFTLAKIACVFIAVALLLGEWLAPVSERLAQAQRSVAMSDKLTLQGKSGLWARDGENFINVREMLPGERLGEVYLYEVDAQRRVTRISRARSASYRDGRWVLENVRSSVIGEREVRVEQESTRIWTTTLSPDLLSVVSVRPDTLSAAGLYQYIGYLHDNGLRAERYEQALWSKLSNVVVIVLMMLIALSFAFGALRSVSVGYRILSGTLAGVAFHLLNQTIGFMGLVYSIEPVLSALLPGLVLLSLTVVMLRRVR